LLGRIPRVRRGAFGSLAAREPFRLLRTNLRLVGEDGASAAVAITSATGGAGRTTTAVNLGLVLAESGIRVLIVQADAKSPLDSAAAGVLRPEVRKNGGGLRQYLLGAATLEETILTTAHPDVACLPLDGAEGPPPDSVPHGLSWLIETPAGRRLTVDLRRHADVVLLDCPPIHEADAALIAARADGVILVVDARHADKPAIGDAIRQLKVIEARILGIVLNRVQHVGKRRLIARSTST
jgi:capsular exopolysaccharide synthesis family protein